MRQTLLRALHSARDLLLPLRRGISQTSQVERETWTRQRRIDLDHNIHQGIDPRTTLGGAARDRLVSVLGINANSFLAAHDAQQSRVVHCFEQARGRI
jgi:hypothetical protein